MPDFVVHIERTVTHTTIITIEAADEDEADAKANALCNGSDTDALNKAMRASKAEWELDEESFEVLEINEE